jgi:DNA invertase Pin-like site-specific DNA recombinase
VAEFEKDIIRERVKAGLETARQKGKRLGRPSINNEILEKARLLRICHVSRVRYLEETR